MKFAGILRFRMQELSLANRLRKSALKPAKSLTSEVFIVAPNRRGSYQSTIVVQTTDGLRIDVPLLIDVQ